MCYFTRLKTDYAATSLALLVGVVLLSLWPISGDAAQLPALPQTFIDTTYSPPSGNTITVNAGGNFQAALNNAELGDTIVLEAGATFEGPFDLSNKTAGSGWIYIQSSAYSSLPAPGNRVSPSDAANMPKLIINASNVGGVIQTRQGAHHYRFVGIEIKPQGSTYVYNVVELENDPSDIVFDRCYVHGNPGAAARRGIALDAARGAVVDSYISDFKDSSYDSQAVWVYNSPGPIKIVNNYLEASGENVMFGGADPRVANLVPSDVEIRRNHFFKPLSWRGANWIVKNLLEFKNIRRVLVEGNLFENNWADGQTGLSILFTPRNQDGSAPWSTNEDITFRLNTVKNVAGGFNISGEDTVYPSEPGDRILIQDNLILLGDNLPGDNRIYQLVGRSGPNNVTIDHNTAVASDALAGMFETGPKGDQLDIKNNIVSSGLYGFIGTGTSAGIETFDAYYTNWRFSKNAVVKGSSNDYPPGNYFPSNNGAVGFVNFAGGDFRLTASSPYKNAGSDGKDLGADIDAISEASSGGSGGGGGGTALPSPQNLQIQ